MKITEQSTLKRSVFEFVYTSFLFSVFAVYNMCLRAGVLHLWLLITMFNDTNIIWSPK